MTDSTFAIGYDASSAVGRRSGIGYSAAKMLEAMIDQWPEHWELHVLVNTMRHSVPREAWSQSPRARVKHTTIPGKVLLRGWQYLKFPPIEMLLGRLDLHHCLASYITPTMHAKLIVHVHDLYFLEGSENEDPFGTNYFRKTFPAGLPKCERVITISDFTRGRVLHHYELENDKVVTIPLGVDLNFFSPNSADSISPNRPYFLCVSTIGPKRKNLPGLVEAWARLKTSGPALPDLVIIGNVEVPILSERLAEIASGAAAGEYLKLLEYVPPDELPEWYRRAEALVIPSFSEGFGLPMLEAMACGTPVIAARAGALPEVGGDAALYADPNSIDELSAALKRMHSDSTLRAKLKLAGLERVKKFTWASAARSLIDLYSDVLQKR